MLAASSATTSASAGDTSRFHGVFYTTSPHYHTRLAVYDSRRPARLLLRGRFIMSRTFMLSDRISAEADRLDLAQPGSPMRQKPVCQLPCSVFHACFYDRRELFWITLTSCLLAGLELNGAELPSHKGDKAQAVSHDHQKRAGVAALVKLLRILQTRSTVVGRRYSTLPKTSSQVRNRATRLSKQARYFPTCLMSGQRLHTTLTNADLEIMCNPMYTRANFVGQVLPLVNAEVPILRLLLLSGTTRQEFDSDIRSLTFLSKLACEDSMERAASKHECTAGLSPAGSSIWTGIIPRLSG